MSAIHERVRPKISYNEYSIGKSLDIALHTLHSDGSLHIQNDQVIVEKIGGGGFFGRILFIKDRQYVVKTPLPDPWHHLWRTVNWNLMEFPSQYEELMAQTEHVGSRIIHTVLPIITEGKFHSPESLGYAQLPTGYTQVVERMEGRPPRYDLERNEYNEFREAQKELTHLAFDLGLEQVGQIHEDNIFGMANLWRDEKNNRWIWLDTIPAIPHRKFVWPFFYFSFHTDIRNQLNVGKLTFNTIHIDTLVKYIKDHSKFFTNEQFNQLLLDSRLYEELLEDQKKLSHRHAVTPAAIAFGNVVGDGAKFVAKAPFKLANKAVIEPIHTVFDKQYRVEPIIKRLEKSLELGLINSDEFEKAIHAIKTYESNNGGYSRDDKILTVLLGSYFLSGNIINAVQAWIGANILLGNQELLSGGELIGLLQIASYLLRPLITLLIGKKTKTDLRAAMSISWLPFGGFAYAIPAQISLWTGSQSKEIWHQTIREFFSNLSALLPYGGTGSQLEGQLMKSQLAKKIETLVKFED